MPTETTAAVTTGANTSDLPYSATIEEDLSEVAVVTAEGQLVEGADARSEFAVESRSQVFTLGLAIRIRPELGHALGRILNVQISAGRAQLR